MAARFTFALNNNFKFPKSIRNDLVYCQRSLRTHIKVHQMIVDNFCPQEDDPEHMRRILEELESEIYEINAEQHFLFLRLRRIIDEFYKTLEKDGIPIDHTATNNLISREIIPLVSEDDNVMCLPCTVQFRNPERYLIDKYFVVDSAEKKGKANNKKSKQPVEQQHCMQSQQQSKPSPAFHQTLPNRLVPQSGGHVENINIANQKNIPYGPMQVSLLKPISERVSIPATNRPSPAFEAAVGVECVLEPNRHSPEVETDVAVDSVLTSNRKLPAFETDDVVIEHVPTLNRLTDSVVENSEPYLLPQPQQYTTPVVHTSTPQTTTTASPDCDEQNKQIILPVSKNVKLSRMNLRQALNKAKTDTLAAKAASAISAVEPVREPVIVAPSTSRAHTAPHRHLQVPAILKPRIETKKPIGKQSEPNSSSEESYDAREYSPTAQEQNNLKTKPEDYDQEMFLRMFHLYTAEKILDMQKRRSKRKRRNVHSNEKADFHYGRIDNYSCQNDKKKKTFLVSPRVNRALKKKPSEEKTPIDRSSSSSPDDNKRICNECMKPGGQPDECVQCKGYYHQTCHSISDIKKPSSSKSVSTLRHRFCPSCDRLENTSNVQEKCIESPASTISKDNLTLGSQYRQLELKLKKEKHRRASLQYNSKIFKIQMRNLINIVHTIKSDQENESSD